MKGSHFSANMEESSKTTVKNKNNNKKKIHPSLLHFMSALESKPDLNLRAASSRDCYAGFKRYNYSLQKELLSFREHDFIEAENNPLFP